VNKTYGQIPLKRAIPLEPELIEKAKAGYRIEESGCWSFSKPSSDGYSKFSYKKKQYAAHRVFYSIFKGELDRGKVLDHICRNRWCVNPRHLEEVSHKENISRGVHADVSGKKNPKWSVSEDNVRKIINLSLDGIPAKEIAKNMPDVGRCAIYHIVAKRNWSHLWTEIEKARI